MELSTRDAWSVSVHAVDLVADGDVWRAEVPDADVGDADLYAFRVDGPWAPAEGHRFDHTKVLIDPYALQVFTPPGDHVAARNNARFRGVDTGPTAPRGVLRRGPEPTALGHTARLGDEVVYETHVRGFTRGDAGVADGRRGTYAGLVDRLDHLSQLGVTVIELLPVHAADPGEGSYWGYMPLTWLAVNDDYAASGDGAAELAALCTAAAARGIAVWLDVVYNHSTEEDEAGPTYQLRGIADGDVLRDPTRRQLRRRRRLRQHPARRAPGRRRPRARLARAVGRPRRRRVPVRPRLDPRARRRRAAAVTSPSCATGSRGGRTSAACGSSPRRGTSPRYQVGDAFPGRDWGQWNDRFRDDVRRFLRGEEGLVAGIAQRVQGSPDIFPGTPTRTVNFIDAHDGFTLYDLVAYDRKHNQANGWNGNDGTDDNHSWNCGFEGDDGAPDEVIALRRRQIRNAFVLLLTSAGLPMFVAGDEFGRTQGGNNNAYNQDNEISWVDWSLLEPWADVTRFVDRDDRPAPPRRGVRAGRTVGPAT